MKIKLKIILACAGISIFSIILSSLVMSYEAITISHNTLKSKAIQQLSTVRDLKKKEIETYISDLRQQATTLAASPIVRQASIDFARVFNSVNKKQDHNLNPSDLQQWYKDSYVAKYNQLNANHKIESSALFDQLGKTAQYFQSMMLLDNPTPAGATQRNYLAYHNEHHPWLTQAVRSFNYDNFFIISPDNANVVYASTKSIDFATSLESGPLKASGLAEAYAKAKTMENGQSIFVDFKPYLGSNDKPVAFIATPIRQGDNFLGVLAIQISITHINDIMTFDRQWKSVGMGESGEVYLVSQNKTLRSDSRFFIQDTDSYFSGLTNAGVSSAIQNDIKVHQTGISLQPTDTGPVRQALSGNTGSATLLDYRGEKVFSTFSHVDLGDTTWAILSEMDEAEGLKAQQEEQSLQNSLIAAGIVTTLVLLAIMLVIGAFVGNYIAKPIGEFSRHLQAMTRNKDLTMHYKSKTNDEFAMLGSDLNQFTSDLCNFFNNLKVTSGTLSDTSVEMTQSAREAKSFAAKQNSENDSVATAATELEASLSQVASLTDEAASKTLETNAKCDSTNQTAVNAKKDMEHLAEKMETTTQTMSQLATESQAIGDVLNVIQAIAEQTNLLALNAAIEAARAGEQGRGFAVVADEVRTLAARTADSTDEIRLKIETLQRDTDTAVKSVEASQYHTTSSINKVDEAVKGILFVSDQISTMNDMSTQIACAADQQSTVTGEISQNVNRIKDMSAEILEKTSDIQRSSEQLNEISEEINQDIAKFKTA